MSTYGGAIKLKGESEYKQALKQITQSLKEVSAQMKLTSATYSSNDSSMSALSAKSANLSKTLEIQTSKLETLKKQYESMNKQYSTNTTAHNALLKKYEDEKTKLDTIGKTLGTTSQEYKAQKEVVSDLEQQVKKSSSAQESNAKSMSDMRVQISRAETDIVKTKNAMYQLDTEMEKTGEKTRQANSAYGTLKNTISEQESKLISLKSAYANVVLEQGKNSDSAKELEREMVGLDSELAKNKAKLNEADTAAGKLSQSLENTGKSAEKSSGGFTVLKGAISNLISNGIQKLASAITGQLDSAISRVDTINSYKKTMENLGYTQQDVAKTTEKLKKGIEGLPTTMPGIVSMQQKYAALSGNLEEATELTLALNNATLSGGQGQEVANSALDQWYQIIATGKPDLTAWNIINSAMPAQMNQIAKAVMGAGKKSQDLFKAWQKGEVTTEQMKKALIELNKKGGGGLTSFEKQVSGATGGINTSMSNLKAGISNGIAKVIDAIGASNIASAFDSFKTIVINVFDALSKVVKFVIDNKEAFISALVAMGTGIATYVAYTTAIKVMEQGWKSLELVQKAVAAAQWLINAAMSANPIGLLVTAVAALTAGFLAYKFMTSETVEKQKSLNEMMNETSKAIDENRKSWEELEKTQQEAVNAQMTEISSYESLYDELQGIVDQNGKVKKGYEERASFITDTLSKALGIEIKNVNGVIQKYDSLKNSIEEVMKKKKAQIILDSQESLYKEAILKQQDALKSLGEMEDLLATKRAERAEYEIKYKEASEIYAKAVENGDLVLMNSARLTMNTYDSKIKKLDEETSSIEVNHTKQLEDVEKYAFNISQYESNMALAHAGKYDEMKNVNWEYVKDYEKAGDAEKAQLEQQVKDTETNLNVLKKLKDKSGSDIYDSQIKAAEKQLSAAKESLKKYVSTNETELKKAEKEWRDSLSKQVSAVTGKKIEFEDAGEGLVSVFIDGVKVKKPMAKEEAEKMAKDMVKKVEDQKSGAKTAGENFVVGVGNGVSNPTKQTSVFSMVVNFGKNLLSKLKASLAEQSPSKATREMGEYLIEGLSDGIDNKENSVLNQIGGVGKNVVSALQDELNQGVTLGNITSSSTNSRYSNLNSQEDMVYAFKKALSQMTVEMDDEAMGKFVEKTVSRAIYT